MLCLMAFFKCFKCKAPRKFSSLGGKLRKFSPANLSPFTPAASQLVVSYISKCCVSVIATCITKIVMELDRLPLTEPFTDVMRKNQ